MLCPNTQLTTAEQCSALNSTSISRVPNKAPATASTLGLSHFRFQWIKAVLAVFTFPAFNHCFINLLPEPQI